MTSIYAYNIPSEKAVKVFEFFSEQLPLMMLNAAAKITDDNKLNMFASIANEVYKQMNDSLETYKFFMEGDWAYKSNKVLDLQRSLPLDQQHDFYFDYKNIDWA